MDQVKPQIHSDFCDVRGKRSVSHCDDTEAASGASTTVFLPLYSSRPDPASSPRFSGHQAFRFQGQPSLATAGSHTSISDLTSTPQSTEPLSPADRRLSKRPSFTIITPSDLPSPSPDEIQRSRDFLRRVLDSDRIQKLKDSLPSRSQTRYHPRRSRDALKKRISKFGLVKRLSNYWNSPQDSRPVVFRRLGGDSQSNTVSQADLQDYLGFQKHGTDLSRDFHSHFGSDFDD